MQSYVRFAIPALLLFLAFAPAAVAQTVSDLLVQKSGPAEANAGSNVSYTVTLTSLGPDSASSVVLSDPTPGTMTFVSATQQSGPAFSCSDPGVGNGGVVTCSIATLAAGESAEFTFVFNIPGGTADGTFFTNIASVTAASFDPNDENDAAVASTTTPPPPTADIYVQKFGPAAAGPDTDVAYSITVGNSGPDTAPDIEWTDTLPGDMTFVSLQQTSGPALSCTTPAVGAGGTITCSGSLNAGTTAVFTLTGHIPNTASSGTAYQNFSSVDASTDDPNTNNNQSTFTVTVTSVDVSVTKTGPANATAGDPITYGITLANGGPDFANASFADVLPAETTFVSLLQQSGPAAACSLPPAGSEGTVSCSVGLASGASAVFDLTITIGNTVSISNTAEAFATQYDSDDTNDTSTVATAVTPASDLAVTKSAPATVAAGANLTWTVAVTNGGISDAANVTLTDPLPANTTFVSAAQNSGPLFDCTVPAAGATGTITCDAAAFAAGETATFTFVARVGAGTAADTIISNTATVAASTNDPDPADDSATAESTVTVASDVGITKTAAGSGVLAGAELTYTITVTNNGPSDAANVQFSDPLPANTTFVSLDQNSGPLFDCVTPAAGTNGSVTCSIASLPAPSTAVFSLTVEVADDATGTVENTVSITSGSGDPNAGNDSSTDATAIFVVAAAIPTLSTWAMLAMIAALAAIVLLRR